MKGSVVLIVLGAIAYFLFQTEGPTTEKHWQAYATEPESGGKIVWVWAPPYASRDECEFNADKATEHGWTKPTGCLYQNPYVQWIVNSIVAPGRWKCIARWSKRENFDDPVYQPVLVGGDNEGKGWKCFLYP
jgi:hypothetical protein